MFTPRFPTRTPETEQEYLRRYRELQRRFCREAQVLALDPNEVVAKLILLKPDLAMSSWRQYKAAVLYYIETREPQYEGAAEVLRLESSAGLKKSSQKTSGRKRKSVPAAAWRGLQQTLQARIEQGRRHAQGLLHVLRATLVTGLRPNEWSFSTIAIHGETGRPVLRVRNSKHSNGRANGEFREFFLDGLTAEERRDIEAALAYCAADNTKEAQRIGEALRHELQDARQAQRGSATKSEGTDVTLYSFRHQFIADAKTTFSDPELLAALVGHNSTDTAFEHYGKRRDGRSPVRVQPTPESVEAVQKVRLQTYRDHVAQQTQPRPASANEAAGGDVSPQAARDEGPSP